MKYLSNTKKNEPYWTRFFSGGERGIRTPGASQLNGFQDRRNRPLCHLSFVGSNFRFSVLRGTA